VIALAPNESAAYGNLGNVRLRERRLDEALALFNKANELTPSSYTFMYNIGQVYMLQGRSAESVAMFRRALKLNPNLREGYFMLGLVLSKQISDEAEALAALRRAATLGHVEAQKFLLSRGETW
jgi:tetratricopeptide (TPR) repeat protein